MMEQDAGLYPPPRQPSDASTAPAMGGLAKELLAKYALGPLTMRGGISEQIAQKLMPGFQSPNRSPLDIAREAPFSRQDPLAILRNPEAQEAGRRMAMGYVGGIKTPEGGVESAFRLPDGRVINTGAFHDYTQLPEPFRSNPAMADQLAGFATNKRFFTREQAAAGDAAGGVPVPGPTPLAPPGTKDPFGYDLNRPPTVHEQHPDVSGGWGGAANQPMPGAPKTRVIGSVNQDLAAHYPANIETPPTYISRAPETPMPTSGLPDQPMLPSVAQNAPPANEPMSPFAIWRPGQGEPSPVPLDPNAFAPSAAAPMPGKIPAGPGDVPVVARDPGALQKALAEVRKWMDEVASRGHPPMPEK